MMTQNKGYSTILKTRKTVFVKQMKVWLGETDVVEEFEILNMGFLDEKSQFEN